MIGSFSTHWPVTAARCIACCLALLGLVACQTTTGGGGVKATLSAQDEGRFSFPTTTPWNGSKTNIRGRLEFPEGVTGKTPLVLIVHSTDGINAAETGWASFWRDQGYATFMLDYMAPRGVGSNNRNIPRSPYDVADALKVLATHPRIDTSRIAVQGLSNGASITVSSAGLNASQADRIGAEPVAYIMLYGGCWYNLIAETMPDAAFLYIVGASDVMVRADDCVTREKLTAPHGKDVRTVVIPGAHHGFDGNETKDFMHPKFGHVVMSPDAAATRAARSEAQKLLQRVFAESVAYQSRATMPR